MVNIMRVQNTEDRGDRFCRICEKDLPLNKFYKRANGKCELVCKKCRNLKREKRHRYYKQQFIYKLSEYLEVKCQRCGYDRNFSALDFHHTGKKTMAIAREIRNLTGKSFNKNEKVDRIIKEILNYCEILCANCHREHHTKHIMKTRK
jgi:hypothetical protein